MKLTLFIAVLTLLMLPAYADTLTLFTQPIAADPSTPPPASIGVGIAICDQGCFALNGQPQFTDNIVFGQVAADAENHIFTLDQSSPDLALLVSAICPNDCPYFQGAPTLFPYFSFLANGQTLYWGDTWGWGSESFLGTGTIDSFTIGVPAIQSFESSPFDPSVWSARNVDGNEDVIGYSISGTGLIATTPEPHGWSLLLCGLGLVWLARKVKL